MKCPNIEGVEFSSTSKRALKRLKELDELSKLLATFTGIGVFANIFLGSNSLAATYSVYSTDFATLTRGLATIPKITRRQIEKIAAETYQQSTNYKERTFWKAIYFGYKAK
ncbi:hypothetical protein DXX93_07580 [Thalassotalea euphylliae]|uniref:Uncharacterized protein n=1 Tax=Thalassotalea euphylliae TaxID=1655234 RepID=A0A3E0TR93_9GAMM|nr:hypothetical protein [Thalassotalea euphylliae]REL26455.1 hypothetical protein DXX93_07580 [Thalassotalea euphylliae]